MSDLEKKIQSDLVESMKARDELRLSTLRMLKAEIQKAKTAKGSSHEISDEDILGLAQRSIKQRREAADQYLAGGARDRSERELQEVEILNQYLPLQLSTEEIDSIISKAADAVRPQGPKDMGILMGKVMPMVKGKADGNMVRKKVSDFLNKLQ